MQSSPEKDQFLDAVRASLADGTFRRITLGKYRGDGEERRCVATPVSIKDAAQVRFVTSRGRQDVTENDVPDAAIERLARLVGADYLSAVLFTQHADLSLIYSKKRVPRLTRGKPSVIEAPSAEHNRQKAYLVDAHAPYLAALGVTHGNGEVKPSMYGKFRQICRFVEILEQMLAGSRLSDAKALRVLDVGSGKGYLTFALHEHLARRLGEAPSTRGIEADTGLVEACNKVALRCAIAGLSFEAGRIESLLPTPHDVLIALHACDTATDDAIHFGIAGGAELIICAPCCQHELAPQLEIHATPLAGLLKYGLLRQRQADLFTDAARGLLLEAHGYDVRMIEFVSTEHTAKNLLIVGVRSDSVDRRAAAAHYEALATLAGFERQRLKTLVERTSQ